MSFFIWVLIVLALICFFVDALGSPRKFLERVSLTPLGLGLLTLVMLLGRSGGAPPL